MYNAHSSSSCKLSLKKEQDRCKYIFICNIWSIPCKKNLIPTRGYNCETNIMFEYFFSETNLLLLGDKFLTYTCHFYILRSPFLPWCIKKGPVCKKCGEFKCIDIMGIKNIQLQKFEFFIDSNILPVCDLSIK